MPEILLDDVIHKYERGEEQLKNFLAKLKDIEVKTPLECEFKRIESLPDTYEYGLFILNVPSIDKELGILLGETVQSFRISLDYLTWALYKANGEKLNEKQERKVAFPISQTKEAFESQIKQNHLSGFPPDQLTIIEKYQPYQNTTGGISMGYLQKISNTDKHKLILRVCVSPKESEIRFKDKPVGANLLGVKIDYIDGEELVSGAKVFTIIMDGEPEKWGSLSMQIKCVYVLPQSIIEPPPQLALAPIDQVVEGIRQTCFDVISEFRYVD